jgi:hypothetical protein
VANDYLGAAAWCEREIRARDGIVDIGVISDERAATLALSCVRAMQALAEGRVELTQRISGTWHAERVDTGFIGEGPDPLTAITLALTEAGDAK